MKNATERAPAVTARYCRAVLLSLLLALPASGMAAEEDKIWEGLFNYQQKMANIGNAEAQYKLAEMYAQGQGVKIDPDQARHWYEVSAAQGYEPARLKLAALDAGEPMVKATAPVPVAVQPPVTQSDTSRQELERMERERQQLEQELARSREETHRLQEQQARQAALLKKAEMENDEARRRLAAKALLEAEMKKLKETPSAFDQ